MKRVLRASLLSLVGVLAACGDDGNSKQCDPGTTMDVDGTCTGNPPMCTDGTILVGDHCEIDPASCQDGTVLVGGKCVDPGHVTPDIEEAAEPNGFGLLGELSTAPAGTIALKPVGMHFVIKGKIIPFQDVDGDGQQDADVDTYQIDVTGPVMLSLSADGLHGLAGGFVSLANVGMTHPLSPWTRFGINPTGDTSKRQLYLPAAGTYLVAVADTRTFLLGGAAPKAEMGKPDFEYYLTVDQVTATPTALTATAGVATSNGQLQPGEVKLFSISMGQGVNSAELDMTIDQVQESMVIDNTNANVRTIKAVADGDPGDVNPASTSLVGIRANDTSIIAVDTVFDYANAAYNYSLTVNVGGAGALSTNGMGVMQPSSTTDFSTFYYDVATDGRIIGMNLAFDRPVSGAIIDEDFFVFSNFTFSPFLGFAGEFQNYRGLLNHERAGRYYFVVFDPAGGTGDITATSTYAGLMPTAIVKGTPLTGQMMNVYQSNPHTYAAGVMTDPWQQFTGTGTGTGNITAAFYRPMDSFGRLDPLTNNCGSLCDDSPIPVFTHSYAEAGTTRGRILLDDMTQDYLVKVRTATTTGTPTYSLDYKLRPHTNVMVMPGTPVTNMNQPLDATTTVQRYLVRTTAGNGVDFLVHPDQVTMDTRFQFLTRDEAASGPLQNNGIAGADDTAFMIQGAGGWSALTVTSLAPIVGGTFDMTVTATAPKTYMQAAGTTAFVDACTAGTSVTMEDTDEGRSTANINTPAGFDFFGFAAPSFRVFTNGFISFDTALVCPSVGGSCFFINADMPNAANPNGLIAPYWDDLVITDICQETRGTKLVIQWDGDTFGSGSQPIQFQAILDGANDTIEFVYGSANMVNGSLGTIGLENQVGGAASKIGFNTAGTIAPRLFTPM
jgi:hypothetical protein